MKIVTSSSNLFNEDTATKAIDILNTIILLSKMQQTSENEKTGAVTKEASNPSQDELIELVKRMDVTGSKQIKKGISRYEAIQIFSKEIKDTNFQVEVSKDLVSKDKKEVIMLSIYAKETYNGQFLIKRNYYYLPDNEKDADESFDEICRKVKKIKENYYAERIISKSVCDDISKILTGIIPDIKFTEEDCIGSTLSRKP